MFRPGVPETIELLYAVYLDGPPPGEDDLEDALDVWLDTHADPPWPALVRRLRLTHGLQVALLRREDAPPVLAGLFSLGLDPLHLERIARAPWVLAVAISDTPLAPRPGLVAAHACAQAWAHSFGGVVVDPGSGRAFTVDGPRARLRATRIPPVADHIVVHAGPTLATRWSTRGMAKFGLADLVLAAEHTPAEGPGRILHATAQALAELVADGLALEPPVSIRLSRAHLDRALARPEPAWRETVEVRIHGGYDSYGAPILRLAPPDAVPAERWRTRVSTVLGREPGEDPSVAHARMERLWRAHDRAVNTFPKIRERSLVGLPPGSELFVRRAFPGPDGRRALVWVLVSSCDREVLGSIADPTAMRQGLPLGHPVRFPLYDVYDWMLRNPDGTTEGAFTVEDSTPPTGEGAVESARDTL